MPCVPIIIKILNVDNPPVKSKILIKATVWIFYTSANNKSHSFFTHSQPLHFHFSIVNNIFFSVCWKYSGIVSTETMSESIRSSIIYSYDSSKDCLFPIAIITHCIVYLVKELIDVSKKFFFFCPETKNQPWQILRLNRIDIKFFFVHNSGLIRCYQNLF